MSDMTTAEYRALGRLMRHARAQGYTYYRTTSFGRTDWSWSKDGNYAVSAEPLAVGWKVHVDDGRAQLWPASVQQLTDVLVAVGLLPPEFSSTIAARGARASRPVQAATVRTGEELAAAGERIGDAEDGLRHMAANFPAAVAVHGGRTQAIGRMGTAILHHFEPFDIVLMLSTAAALLSESGVTVCTGCSSPDLFAEDVVPAGPHAVATVTRSQDGTPVAVCVCSAVFTADDEDTAVSALDAHLAEAVGRG